MPMRQNQSRSGCLHSSIEPLADEQCMLPEEEWSRSGWLHSFLRLVMMPKTPSEGSEALPDMRAATLLDLNTSLYSSTCNLHPFQASVCASVHAAYNFCNYDTPMCVSLSVYCMYAVHAAYFLITMTYPCVSPSVTTCMLCLCHCSVSLYTRRLLEKGHG